MAYKKYAYYNKGNKIALIEKAESTSSGFLAVAHCTLGGYTTKDTCEAAGGQWIPGSSGSTETVGEYKSPVEDVANGLEVEYTYAPTYNINSVEQVNKFIANGWYVDEDGYVNLIQSGVDIAALGTLARDLYIVIDGSQLWNGLHKIKSVGTEVWEGNVQLHTKYQGSPYIAATNFNFDAVDQTLSFAQAEDFVKEGDYMVIVGAAALTDTFAGLFKVGTIVGDNDITLDKRYTIVDSSSSQYTPDDFEVESASSVGNGIISCKAYKGYRDPMSASLTTVMEDETFELDLTRYQANAVVLYLQAKKFEDAGDVKISEYYMRKFKRQLEKASGSRKYGPHIIQGNSNMRK